MDSKRWTVETLNATVDREIAALPEDLQARYFVTVERIENHGITEYRRESIEEIDGASVGDAPAWPRRNRPRHVRYRSWATIDRRASVCQKDPANTSKREIDLALKRAKEVL